jgi:hypothetical protein
MTIKAKNAISLPYEHLAQSRSGRQAKQSSGRKLGWLKNNM